MTPIYPAAASSPWESRISPVDYLTRFDLEIPVLSSRWQIEEVDRNRFLVTLPNRVRTHISSDAADLSHMDAQEFQTTMLWKHSLAALPVMASSQLFDGVEAVLSAYADFLSSEAWGVLSAQMASLDHCVAMRIRTMCTLRAMYASLERALPEALSVVLLHDLAWASAKDNYALNNHGLMLGLATMHAAEVFPAIAPAETTTVGAEMFQVIILGAFGDDWICIENTPEYHAFYITLCTKALDFLGSSGMAGSEIAAQLTTIIERATDALAQCVLPDGKFPALGDSGTLVPSSVVSVDGTLVSTHTGLYISKRDESFVSFKCGSATYVHKHMDDTSLTLVVDGEELLLDGGLHNYDWHDPITRAVKSQRGHSGAFFPEFDHLYPSTMYRPEKLRVDSKLQFLGTSGDATVLAGRSTIDETHRVARLVTHAPGEITVVDRFWLADGTAAEAPPVQRFLVPADFVVSVIRPGVTRYAGARAWLEIEVDPSREVIEHVATDGDLPRGWFSRAWSQSIACRSIDIVAPPEGPARARLRYGRHGLDAEVAPGGYAEAAASTDGPRGAHSPGSRAEASGLPPRRLAVCSDGPIPTSLYAVAKLAESVRFTGLSAATASKLDPGADIVIVLTGAEIVPAAALVDELLSWPERTGRVQLCLVNSDAPPVRESIAQHFHGQNVTAIETNEDCFLLTIERSTTSANVATVMWSLSHAGSKEGSVQPTGQAQPEDGADAAASIAVDEPASDYLVADEAPTRTGEPTARRRVVSARSRTRSRRLRAITAGTLVVAAVSVTLLVAEQPIVTAGVLMCVAMLAFLLFAATETRRALRRVDRRIRRAESRLTRVLVALSEQESVRAQEEQRAVSARAQLQRTVMRLQNDQYSTSSHLAILLETMHARAEHPDDA